jgi:ATP-dependent Clp protease ATP-binding subunit ClpC
VRRSAAGLRGRKRPLGTFLFLGSTCVGKTETARAIAEVFFPGSPMTRIDMSDLSEAHGVARLLGAPPGYVGHDEGVQLTEAVRGRPYQLVLLDEIEKAHRDVLLALLPLLEDGRLTDGRGRTVDFTNTIVVMTSNLGVEAEGKPAASRIGFGGGGAAVAEERDARAITAARRALPPELWNRIDEPIFFAPLGRAEVRLIADGLVAKLAASVEHEHGIVLQVESDVLDHLVDTEGYDVTLGARPIRRAIARRIEAKVADAILRGARGTTLRVLIDVGEIVVHERAELDAAE